MCHNVTVMILDPSPFLGSMPFILEILRYLPTMAVTHSTSEPSLSLHALGQNALNCEGRNLSTRP